MRVRRIVTGYNAAGKAVVKTDEELTAVPRVAGGIKRKVHSGPDGLQMLVIGGCPGKAYEVSEMTELTAA